MTLIDLFKKLRPYVRPYRWLIIITLILTLIGSLIAQVNAVVLDRTVDAINSLIGKGSFEWARAARIITIISAVLLGKEILAIAINYSQNYFGERMRIFVSKDLSQAAVDKILSFRLGYFSAADNQTGKLQTRIDQGVSSLSRTVQNFFIDLLPLFTSAVLALILMFSANLYVGLAALGIIPIYIWITLRQARKLRGWRGNMRRYRESKSHGVMNIIESMNVIKSFNRESIESAKQWDIQTKFTDNQMLVRKTSFFFDGLKRFVSQFGTVIIIILTAYLVLIQYPGMSIGKIMYHVMLFANVTAPINQLQRIFDDMNDALVYSESYFGILNADGEVEGSGSYRPEKVKGDFELEGVDFTYPGGTQALWNVSMKIPSGKVTALVGLSGAGKSTIVNLLDKFYEPGKGSVKLDGVDLREWDTKFLRENVGLVLQKNHIFDGTVEENIRYGKPDASPEEVVEAAKKAYIYEQLMELPKGFQTKAQELSGGQQQRIAIARLFLKDPPIILLDEPTASQDAVATEQIKAGIDAIKAGRTVVTISHNISQIIDSDLIYALRKGRVEQGGSPEEVYRQGGIYKEILDASARSLNIDKIVETMDIDGDGLPG